MIAYLLLLISLKRAARRMSVARAALADELELICS
jgi:hypothetical protein